MLAVLRLGGTRPELRRGGTWVGIEGRRRDEVPGGVGTRPFESQLRRGSGDTDGVGIRFTATKTKNGDATAKVASYAGYRPDI